MRTGQKRRYVSKYESDASVLNFIEFPSDPRGCWEWTGPRQIYGIAKTKSGQAVAHRVVWNLLNGPIKKNYVLDHLCGNHGCVNVNHLEEVTLTENSLRGACPNVPLDVLHQYAVARERFMRVKAQITKLNGAR